MLMGTHPQGVHSKTGWLVISLHQLLVLFASAGLQQNIYTVFISMSLHRLYSIKMQIQGPKLLTGDEHQGSREGEPLALGQGEELSHEHKQAQDGEDASQHCSGLHYLEVFYRGVQREQGSMRWEDAHTDPDTIYSCHTEQWQSFILIHNNYKIYIFFCPCHVCLPAGVEMKPFWELTIVKWTHQN